MTNYQKKLQIRIDKKAWKIIGIGVAAVLLIGIIFFFAYFRVTNIEVMDSSYYSESEVKEMILQGPLAYNSVLAPILCSKDDAGDIPFVEGFRVKQMNHNTIVISVKEKKPVGCIPYLDSYIYFDRNGIFIESSKERMEKIPFFDGIQVDTVIKNEKLPMKGTTILNTAVALSTIFQKNDTLPDHIQFDEKYQITLIYGDITVQLGEDEYLEDKMARVFAILPLLEGKKGILHMESVNENGRPTFEAEIEEAAAENWTGGYDENGDYTGDGEYDENGDYVGPKPDLSENHDSGNEESGNSGEDGYGEDSYNDDSYDYGWEEEEYYNEYYDDGYDDNYYDGDYYDDGYYEEDWEDSYYEDYY